MGSTPVSAPVDSQVDAFFWEGARRGELLIQRCSSCGELRHPPAPMCPDCHSLEWDTVRSAGTGSVYSWIVSHHPSRPDDSPRLVVLIDLDEGTRIVSNLVGIEVEAVTIGMRVEVAFADQGSFTLPQFAPAGVGS